ncbi:MAG TPA: hypothetical protein VHO47_04000 [Candidatus Babeliales bacterium]|nr:hypothetical protein [Candidatus Babeliales bacterium]
MAYCFYYQAHIERSRVWMFAAILRSYEHLVFERTIDKQESVFEFFVPVDNEVPFLELMEVFKQKEIVRNLNKLPNRLMQADTVV